MQGISSVFFLESKTDFTPVNPLLKLVPPLALRLSGNWTRCKFVVGTTILLLSENYTIDILSLFWSSLIYSFLALMNSQRESLTNGKLIYILLETSIRNIK